MKKINIIKENKEFERIIKQYRPYRTEIANIYYEEGNYDVYRFGISVSKKIGSAVVRNRLKRQIKSIIDKNIYQKKFNCIIILKKEILDKSYDEMEKILNNAFESLKIKKEQTNEKD